MSWSRSSWPSAATARVLPPSELNSSAWNATRSPHLSPPCSVQADRARSPVRCRAVRAPPPRRRVDGGSSSLVSCSRLANRSCRWPIAHQHALDADGAASLRATLELRTPGSPRPDQRRRRGAAPGRPAARRRWVGIGRDVAGRRLAAEPAERRLELAGAATVRRRRPGRAAAPHPARDAAAPAGGCVLVGVVPGVVHGGENLQARRRVPPGWSVAARR